MSGREAMFDGGVDEWWNDGVEVAAFVMEEEMKVEGKIEG